MVGPDERPIPRRRLCWLTCGRQALLVCLVRARRSSRHTGTFAAVHEFGIDVVDGARSRQRSPRVIVANEFNIRKRSTCKLPQDHRFGYRQERVPTSRD